MSSNHVSHTYYFKDDKGRVTELTSEEVVKMIRLGLIRHESSTGAIGTDFTHYYVRMPDMKRPPL